LRGVELKGKFPTGDDELNLDRALDEHEVQVDTLLKSANKFVGALKAWKKACQSGHIGNLQKAAAQAGELSVVLPETTADTQSAWDFDIRDYLETDAWRKELQAVAAERFSLRTLEDDDTLISSPITVRAQPARSTLALGKVNWPTIRPSIVAAELKRLRDRTAAANSQEFVESLCGACVHLSSQNDPHAKFRDIYDLFCLTPGFKKENPTAAFGQQIYALHRSEVRMTRGHRRFEIEYATGNYKEKDVFTVLSEDGRPLRYFTIFFK
jgi:hypothetical protein